VYAISFEKRLQVCSCDVSCVCRAAQSTMAPQPPVLFVVVNYKQQVAPFPLISSHPKLGRGVG